MPEHIKMPEILPIVRYLANGTETVFTYPFPIFASEDLQISFNGVLRNTGFDVADAGNTNGGQVTFDTAPATGTIVTLERRLPLERLTDFIEGGDFSARAINNELDFLVAAIQQVSGDQTSMLRYEKQENPANLTLPAKSERANKGLGFDADGNPVPVSLTGASPHPDFLASGTGALSRSVNSKLADAVSVKDFGAVGDGLTDDTEAFQQALTAHDFVFVPSGEYLISSSITLGEKQNLIGAGNSSILRANGDGFAVIEFVAGKSVLSSLKIEQAETAIKLYGREAPCVANLVSDIVIDNVETGIVLDGYTDTAKPCYWNRFRNVLIERPSVNGIHFIKSGAGDKPSANIFESCRVYSLGTDISGNGIYVKEGSNQNIFLNCEVNVKGTASACVLIGANAQDTMITNLFTLSDNLVPNVKLEAGSQNTVISNLLANSNGAAIWDFSGGNYTAYNAGYPHKNRLAKTKVLDIEADLLRYDTEYIDSSGTVDIDLSHSLHLVSSFNGALTIRLPEPEDALGAEITVKKIDISTNLVTVTTVQGNGIDGKSIYLGGRYDFVTMVSNGAEWFITSSNRQSGNDLYYDGAGIFDVDMSADVYLLSSFSGVLEARLPPADAPEAIGRTLTIKKTDPSSNTVTVTENGGAGPDQSSQFLNARYEAVTVFSNGAEWYVISKI